MKSCPLPHPKIAFTIQHSPLLQSDTSSKLEAVKLQVGVTVPQTSEHTTSTSLKHTRPILFTRPVRERAPTKSHRPQLEAM